MTSPIYAHLKPGVSIPAALGRTHPAHDHGNEHQRHGRGNTTHRLPLQEELTWLAGATCVLSLIVLFRRRERTSAHCLCQRRESLAHSIASTAKRAGNPRRTRSGTPRLIRQLLTEGASALAVPRGTGIFLGDAVIHLFTSRTQFLYRWARLFRINAPVLFFTAVLSVLTTALSDSPGLESLET